MFWKLDKLNRSLSLVTKLMIFYTLSTIGLITAIGFFIYPTFIKLIGKVQANDVSNLTAECYEKIIIILLLGSLISIFFGYVVARKSLHRIQEFENNIEKISAESLHERLKMDEWPKELKRLAEKFNFMLDRLQSSFAKISHFSSDIAHELRTPIHNLRGLTEVALSKEKTANEYRQVLEKHMDEYYHLSKLIENLLFLARSDHGHLILKKELINAKDEILKICDYYEVVALENNIKLSCIGNTFLNVDNLLFKRVINNLFANAIKYTKPGEEINIEIESNKEWNIIHIKDSGIGIPDHQLSQIFERFYRIDHSRSVASGGIGLGLAIVKSIMDLHKGKIVVESQLNQGTVVTLYFPK